jgi:hypothetical protein
VSVTFKTLLDMTKLKDIKEFNMLQRNLELTKTLQDVDRLKAENIDLNSTISALRIKIKSLEQEKINALIKSNL